MGISENHSPTLLTVNVGSDLIVMVIEKLIFNKPICNNKTAPITTEAQISKLRNVTKSDILSFCIIK